MKLERDVVPGVHRIEDAYTNWYLLEDAGRLTVVDAGVPTSWDSLHAVLGQLGRRPEDIEAVVLTHAHFDHVGFAERARTELGVPVWIHEDDVPLSRHPGVYDFERGPWHYAVSYPRSLKVIASLARNRAWLAPGLKEVHRYDDTTEVLDVPGSPRVVPTPGHTLGHCALHLPDRGVLFAGDAVVMFDPYMAVPGPKVVARAATADSERAKHSLRALGATEAPVVLTGHGPAWRQGAQAAADQALQAPVG